MAYRRKTSWIFQEQHLLQRVYKHLTKPTHWNHKLYRQRTGQLATSHLSSNGTHCRRYSLPAHYNYKPCVLIRILHLLGWRDDIDAEGFGNFDYDRNRLWVSGSLRQKKLQCYEGRWRLRRPSKAEYKSLLSGPKVSWAFWSVSYRDENTNTN